MAVISVFGASPPPGTYAVFSDGAPSIRLATRFYRYGSQLTADATIVGGRVWLPSAPPAGVTGLRIMLWAGASSITTTPLQSVVVPISGTGWQVGMFASATPIPDVGVRFKIGYEFVGGSTSDDVYVFSSNTRTAGVLIPLDNGLAYSEDAASFASGGGEVDAAQKSVGYGIDAIVDEGTTITPPSNVAPVVSAGVDQAVAYGATVTLSGTASDSDGTIASTSWTQLSGPGVTLSGTGLTRTFVANASGVLTFRFSAVDDDGASSNDSMTVIVAAQPSTSSNAATSSGALKRIIESAGLSVAAYRDALPRDHTLPVVTIDEEVATSPERHGDTGDPLGHPGESEVVFVHLWQAWRDSAGKPAERYDLPRKLSAALRNARPFLYGSDDAPVRVYGLRIDGRARIVEDDENVVHTTLTITLRRDA